ncbi:capsid cement protein [Nocardioides sp.]|uniref:capsid cement protein n=1 Tax=Nocardioides sp. TaxID=35761 RepID=UPI0035652746
MGDTVRIYEPGAPITLTASAAVTGGADVEVSGDLTVAHPAAGDSAKIVGSAAHDAILGADVVVFPRGSGVRKGTASGAIDAGDLLKSDTGGTLTPWGTGVDDASLVVGLALAAAADTESVTYLVL